MYSNESNKQKKKKLKEKYIFLTIIGNNYLSG